MSQEEENDQGKQFAGSAADLEKLYARVYSHHSVMQDSLQEQLSYTLKIHHFLKQIPGSASMKVKAIFV